jgi:hypothetical protein
VGGVDQFLAAGGGGDDELIVEVENNKAEYQPKLAGSNYAAGSVVAWIRRAL